MLSNTHTPYVEFSKEGIINYAEKIRKKDLNYSQPLV